MVSSGVLTAVTVLMFVTAPLSAQTAQIDIKKEAKEVLMYVRDIVTRAREGSSLENILKDVLDLQNVTVDLLARLSLKEISECETQSVIKMATDRVGSHVVLGVMLAESYADVLSTRLGLALAFMDSVAQTVEDKLSLSSDFGPELTAIIFGTNTTASVISSADESIQKEIIRVGKQTRSKRQTVITLGRGFDVINHEILWRDTIGHHTICVPAWHPFASGHHVVARSPQGWSGGLTGSGSLDSGNLQGKVGWTSPNGRFSAGLNGGFGWGPGGLQPSAGFSVNFKF